MVDRPTRTGTVPRIDMEEADTKITGTDGEAGWWGKKTLGDLGWVGTTGGGGGEGDCPD